MNVKIRANEKFFNDWDRLSFQIKTLSVIIQNDCEIPSESILDWEKDAHKHLNLLSKLISDITSYLQSGLNPRLTGETKHEISSQDTIRNTDNYLFQAEDD